MKSIIQLSNGYCLKYNLVHPHKVLIHIYNEIKSFIHRGIYGFAKRDVWGLNYYLAIIISNSVGHLKDNHYSYPSQLTEKQWSSILDEIANGFKMKVKIDNMVYKSKEWEEANIQAEKAMHLFLTYFDGLWD
jgi:hypothetical protein